MNDFPDYLDDGPATNVGGSFTIDNDRASIAIDFLEKLRPGGPWVLTAILPDGPTITITATKADAVANFIRTHNGKRNIYYSVNPIKVTTTKKAKKSDIAAIEYLLADLDPKDDETPEAAKARYRSALETHKPVSTAIVDSGNGIQALWRLAEPIKLEGDCSGLIANVEGRVKALMETMGSVAGTQNIDRILRLPGTINLPNKTKLKHGRVPCPTALISFNGATCKVDDFPLPPSPEGATTTTNETTKPEIEIDWAKVEEHAGWLKGAGDLPLDFSEKGKIIVGHVGNLKDLNAELEQANMVEKKYGSWSEVVFALAAIFKADSRFTLEQIAAALMCDLPCNRHVTQVRLSDQRRIVERTLKRSYEPEVPRIARMLPWRETTAKGFPVASMHNARLAITDLGISCSYDTFHNKMLFGYKDEAFRHELGDELSDNAVIMLRQIMSDRYCFDLTERYTRDAVTSLALEHCFDPVCDMLDKAEADWDGVERLDRMAVDYLNSEDTDVNRACVRKMMIAAVHRARVPGCKFDNMLVLEGPEGWNKSSAFAVLAGHDNFSDEKIMGKESREVQEQLATIWIHENADLAGMRKAEVEQVKAFASRQVDIAREAYGHFVKKQKRHSIEVGSTNNDRYLQSQTGNRRFWPLKLLKPIDLDKLRRDRLQLWGEAAKYEHAGERVMLDAALWTAAAEAQEKRRTTDAWEVKLADIPTTVRFDGHHYEYPTPKVIVHFVGNQERVATLDLLEDVLRIPNAAQLKQTDTMRLSNVMKALGWERPDNDKKIWIGNKQTRGYFRQWIDQGVLDRLRRRDPGGGLSKEPADNETWQPAPD